MIRSLFLSVLFFSVLLSSEYPQRFSQLGTPLYKSLKQIKKYEDIQPLQEYILTYEQKANKTMSHGFKADLSKDRDEIKQYGFIVTFLPIIAPSSTIARGDILFI
jgi:hypothetical protein